jgi:hypothetical protein
VDYRGLKKLIVKNKLILFGIDDLLDRLHGAMIFSKIDFRSYCHHIYVKNQDVPKMSFIINYGHYEFMVMSFGLTITLATFIFNLINKYIDLESCKPTTIPWDGTKFT